MTAPTQTPGAEEARGPVLTLDVAALSRWIAFALCAVLAAVSLGRHFGTDIGNYRWYFSDPRGEEAIASLEPLYLWSARLLQGVGANPELVIDLVAIASFALLAAFAAREPRPLATLVIAFGWLLFQQYWGTIRTGLAITVLLHADRTYLDRGRFPKLSLLGPVLHWSMIAHPLSYFVRCSPRVALIASTAVFVAMKVLGSVRERLFALLPSGLAVVANYAAQQREPAVTGGPVLSAFVIQVVLVIALWRAVQGDQLRRLLGPLTLLFAANCVFYDFDLIGSRVSNVLVGFKILALCRLHQNAGALPGPRVLVRIALLAYAALTAVQYVMAHQEYFT